MVIEGSGITGCIAALSSAAQGATVTLVERRTAAQQELGILVRDRHAHVCVADAWSRLSALLPEFKALLASSKSEFDCNIGDPGTLIRWDSPAGVLVPTEIGQECYAGPYGKLAHAFLELVQNQPSIRLLQGIEVTALQPEHRSLTLSNGESIRYDQLLLASGTFGESQPRYAGWGLEFETEPYSARCTYDSFEIDLSAPLLEFRGFLSEADPATKDVSFLYVPRTDLTGILTVGSFGKAQESLSIQASPQDLTRILDACPRALPRDFVSKIARVSFAARMRPRAAAYHKLASRHAKQGIFLIGDALLNIPPYLGLGIASGLQSLKALELYQSALARGGDPDFHLLFEREASQILARLSRYEKQWGSQPRARRRKPNFKTRLLLRIVRFMIESATRGQNPAAARYLMRRFHLTLDGSYGALIQALLSIVLHDRFKLRKDSHAGLLATYRQRADAS